MYLIYSEDNGELLGRFSCPPHLLATSLQNLPAGQDALLRPDGVSAETHYFDLANTIRPRPEITATPSKTTVNADGIDEVVVTGLPVPCTATLDDAQYEVTDGEVRFAVDTVGTYTLTIEAFPYISKTWEIEAV